MCFVQGLVWNIPLNVIRRVWYLYFEHWPLIDMLSKWNILNKILIKQHTTVLWWFVYWRFTCVNTKSNFKICVGFSEYFFTLNVSMDIVHGPLMVCLLILYVLICMLNFIYGRVIEPIIHSLVIKKMQDLPQLIMYIP